MTRFTLKGLAARKLRSALTAIAIVLGVAMVSGTFVLTDTMGKAFDSIFASSYQQTDAVVSGRKIVAWSQTGKATVPEAVLSEIRGLPQVEAASGSLVDLGGDSDLATILDNDPINFLLSTNAITVAEGGANSFSVRLLSAPASNVSITTARTSGSTNLNVTSGATLTFTPANWNVFQPVSLSAAEDADTGNETATFTVANGSTLQSVTATGVDNDVEALRIVAVELTGGDVIIRFTTSANRSYRVERTDGLGGNPWIAVGGTVTGTGAVVPVTDVAGAGQARRFYRVVLL